MSLTWLNPARIESVTEPVPTLPLPREVPSNNASPPLNILEGPKSFFSFSNSLMCQTRCFLLPSHGKGLQPYGVSESQTQLKNKPRLLRFPDYKREIKRITLRQNRQTNLISVFFWLPSFASVAVSLPLPLVSRGRGLFFFGGGSCFRFLLQQVGGRGWKGFKSSAAAAGKPSPPPPPP